MTLVDGQAKSLDSGKYGNCGSQNSILNSSLFFTVEAQDNLLFFPATASHLETQLLSRTWDE
jgi:hypothetical protein